MYKIAVLGPYDSIYGFATLGLDIFAVSGAEEGEEKLKKLAASDYAVVYITEGLAAEMTHEIEKYSLQLTPAIILIPGVARKIGYVESVTLPGASAMDVCLPIVVRATSGNTAVYSFISGTVLSFMVPVLVPLFV